MGFDKKMLEQILGLPDAQLLQMIRLMSGGNFSGKDFSVDEKKMRQMRAVLSEITDSDLSRIAELVAVYQNVQ